MLINAGKMPERGIDLRGQTLHTQGRCEASNKNTLPMGNELWLVIRTRTEIRGLNF